jgi:hypothetical protein
MSGLNNILKLSFVFIVNLTAFAQILHSFWEPKFLLSNKIIQPKKVLADDLGKAKRKKLYLVDTSLLKDDTPIKHILKKHQIEGVILGESYDGRGVLLNSSQKLFITGKVFINISSFFEKFFAKSVKIKCLVQISVDDKLFIIYPELINSEFDFNCQNFI